MTRLSIDRSGVQYTLSGGTQLCSRCSPPPPAPSFPSLSAAQASWYLAVRKNLPSSTSCARFEFHLSPCSRAGACARCGTHQLCILLRCGSQVRLLSYVEARSSQPRVQPLHRNLQSVEAAMSALCDHMQPRYHIAVPCDKPITKKGALRPIAVTSKLRQGCRGKGFEHYQLSGDALAAAL